MKRAFVFVTDQNFIEQTQALIGALARVGGWRDDFAVIHNGITAKSEAEFNARGIGTISAVEETRVHWAKRFIFSGVLKQWDRVCYLDQDFVVYGDVNAFFDQPGDFLADHDWGKISDQFQEKFDPALYEALGKEYDLTRGAFIASCILFDPKKINDIAIDELHALANKYAPINHLNGDIFPDQPIFNLYFKDVWSKITGVNFVKMLFPQRKISHVPDDGIVLSHTTNWYRLWMEEFGYRDIYLENLNHFRGMK